MHSAFKHLFSDANIKYIISLKEPITDMIEMYVIWFLFTVNDRLNALFLLNAPFD